MIMIKSFYFTIIMVMMTLGGCHGESATLRSLITNRLTVGSYCNKKMDKPDVDTRCKSKPSKVVGPEGGPASNCPSGTSPIWISEDKETYIQMCGKKCKYSDTIRVDMQMGGNKCTGNKKVDISCDGIMLNSPETGESCTPCLDAKMNVAPEDEANAIACGVSDAAFGTFVCAAMDPLDAGKRIYNDYLASSKGWKNAGKSIADTGKSAGKAIGKAFGGGKRRKKGW